MIVSECPFPRNTFLVLEKIGDLKNSIHAYLYTLAHNLVLHNLQNEIDLKIKASIKLISPQDCHGQFPELIKIMRLYYMNTGSMENDLTICLPQGSVQVNGFLFRASSPYFDSLFKQAQGGDIALKDLSFYACRMLCDFIHTGRLPPAQLPHSMKLKYRPLINLVYAAQKYGMTDLLSECQKALLDFIETKLGMCVEKEGKQVVAELLKLNPLPLPELKSVLFEKLKTWNRFDWALENMQFPEKRESLPAQKDRLFIRQSLDRALKENWNSNDFIDHFDEKAIFYLFKVAIEQASPYALLGTRLFRALTTLYYSARLDPAIALEVLEIAQKTPALIKEMLVDTFDLTLFDEKKQPRVFHPEKFAFAVHTELFNTLLTGPFEEACTKKIACSLISPHEFAALLEKWIHDQDTFLKSFTSEFWNLSKSKRELLFLTWDLSQRVGLANYKPLLEDLLCNEVDADHLKAMLAFAIEEDCPALLNHCVQLMKKMGAQKDIEKCLSDKKAECSPELFEAVLLYQQSLDSIKITPSSLALLSNGLTFPRAKSLDLTSFQEMSDENFSRCMQSFPNIISLKLGALQGMTKNGWSALATLKQLQSLEIHIHITRNTTLSLSWLNSLNLNWIKNFLPHLKNVKIRLPHALLSYPIELDFFSSLPKSLDKIEISLFGKTSDWDDPGALFTAVLSAMLLNYFFIDTGVGELFLGFSLVWYFLLILDKCHFQFDFSTSWQMIFLICAFYCAHWIPKSSLQSSLGFALLGGFNFAATQELMQDPVGLISLFSAIPAIFFAVTVLGDFMAVQSKSYATLPLALMNSAAKGALVAGAFFGINFVVLGVRCLFNHLHDKGIFPSPPPLERLVRHVPHMTKLRIFHDNTSMETYRMKLVLKKVSSLFTHLRSFAYFETDNLPNSKPGIDDETLLALAQNNPGLHSIKMNQSNNDLSIHISNSAVQNSLSFCRQLKKISFSTCVDFDQDTLEALFKHPTLKSLNRIKSLNHGDFAFQKFLTKPLKSFSIEECPQISFEMLFEILWTLLEKEPFYKTSELYDSKTYALFLKEASLLMECLTDPYSLKSLLLRWGSHPMIFKDILSLAFSALKLNPFTMKNIAEIDQKEALLKKMKEIQFPKLQREKIQKIVDRFLKKNDFPKTPSFSEVDKFYRTYDLVNRIIDYKTTILIINDLWNVFKKKFEHDHYSLFKDGYIDEIVQKIGSELRDEFNETIKKVIERLNLFTSSSNLYSFLHSIRLIDFEQSLDTFLLKSLEMILQKSSDLQLNDTEKLILCLGAILKTINQGFGQKLNSQSRDNSTID